MLSASAVQAITAALLLQSGPRTGANALIIIVAGLIGLLSQHPRYARSSIRIIAIGLSVLAASIAACDALGIVIASLWRGDRSGPSFMCLILIAAASTVSVASLAMQAHLKPTQA